MMTHEEMFIALASQEFVRRLQVSAVKHSVNHADLALYHMENNNSDDIIFEAKKSLAYMNLDIALNELNI